MTNDTDKSTANGQSKQDELAELKQRVEKLESELADTPDHWEASGFYTTYYATTGFMLGIFGAATSLLFNIVGSALVDQNPLKIIQIYLTFPLGEQALSAEFDSGIAMAVGCCLYLATGMIFGVIFQIGFAKLGEPSTLSRRLLLATGMGLILWLVNFYCVLSWLQPMLFNGRWIVDLVPWKVAAATHIVFAWTMALVYPLGAYRPYYRQSEK